MADETDDKRPMHSEPDEQAIEEPTTSGAQEASETAWMMKEGVTIGLISIMAVLVLALGLMQGTGLVDFLAPFADTGLGQWAAFAVLVLIVVAAFVWSRRGV
ncbi:hypothetical protein [Natrinema halophilum]|uniref:Uncharacterized protein n=1 Tax=Natrinema halophilum TaxID=1699371 RepID=A0A7D5KR16_9EURY|nr:hypothetical protein [Natrinema halophilum]QLG47984.1 hypothetical protein HYG82_03560 [Natrinema halophilum]